MGVRGLQSFLKENRQSLCISAPFPSSSRDDHDRTPIIVDAWGVIFQLYLDTLPWCSGGEYLRFHRIVRRLIEAWRHVGLEPVFVFDGSTPPEKHDTVLGRIRQNYKTALLFHTTSASSRSSPSFSRSAAILPPFVAQTFIHALQVLKVETYFAPDGEADAMCVTIGNQLHGYVVGNDSDFLILISSPHATNVKGYCPLDMFMWIEGQGAEHAPAREETPKDDQDGWHEWSSARSKRAPPPARQSHFLPPSDYTNPTLVLNSISPSALRTRLRLPASIMPLFASFVGNDYTPISYAEIFFEHNLSPVQRVEKVARIMRETVFAPSSKVGNAGDQAVDLVRKVIRKLVVREIPNDVVLQSMVDTIIESTFQYLLPPLPDHGLSHPFDQTPRISSSSVEMDETRLDSVNNAKKAYALLQKKGFAGAVTHAYLYPGRIYLWPILEDPAGPSLRASEALRGIRRQAWSLLEVACGGLCWPEPTDSEIKALKEDILLRDLLGVVDEVESALKNAPKQAEVEVIDDQGPGSLFTEGDGSDIESSPSEAITLSGTESKESPDVGEDLKATAALKAIRPRVLKEFTRQGSSQRIVEVIIPLPPAIAAANCTACLGPLKARLDMYLEAFSSNTPKIHALPANLHPLIAATRMTILEISERSGPRPDPKLRGGEVMAILRMGIGMLAAWEKEGRVWRSMKDNDEGSWPILGNRQSGIVAQLNAVMLEGLLLAQALLLQAEEESHNGRSNTNGNGNQDESDESRQTHKVTHLTPFIFISGVALHQLLNHQDPAPSTGWRWSSAEDDMLERVAGATIEGIEDHVVGWKRDVNAAQATPPPAERQAKEKKGHKKKNTAEAHVLGKMGGSRFDLLNGISL